MLPIAIKADNSTLRKNLLFEGFEYDEETDFERGKIFILENDEKTGDGVINIDDIQLGVSTR